MWTCHQPMFQGSIITHVLTTAIVKINKWGPYARYTQNWYYCKAWLVQRNCVDILFPEQNDFTSHSSVCDDFKHPNQGLWPAENATCYGRGKYGGGGWFGKSINFCFHLPNPWTILFSSSPLSTKNLLELLVCASGLTRKMRSSHWIRQSGYHDHFHCLKPGRLHKQHPNMTVCVAHSLSDIGFPVIHYSKELSSNCLCCSQPLW